MPDPLHHGHQQRPTDLIIANGVTLEASGGISGFLDHGLQNAGLKEFHCKNQCSKYLVWEGNMQV